MNIHKGFKKNGKFRNFIEHQKLFGSFFNTIFNFYYILISYESMKYNIYIYIFLFMW